MGSTDRSDNLLHLLHDQNPLLTRLDKPTLHHLAEPDCLFRPDPTKSAHNASQTLGVIVVLAFFGNTQHGRQQIISRSSPFWITIFIGGSGK
jgi:hypothetical protein